MDKRKLIPVIAVCLAVALIAVLIYFMPEIKMNINAGRYALTDADLSVRADRIYFLNTGGADAILIESNGKFALVDAAEDSDNPRGFEELVYEGTEGYVVECVKKIAGNEEGKALYKNI